MSSPLRLFFSIPSCKLRELHFFALGLFYLYICSIYDEWDLFCPYFPAGAQKWFPCHCRK